MADLTTTSKVKDFLGISSASYDTTFAVLIKGVSADIERICGRRFEEDTYTEYFDVESGDTMVFLKNYPVSSLTSVQYRSGTWGAIVWTDYNSNDYLLNENGKVTFSGPFPNAEKFVKVIYTGGYKIDFANENNESLHTLPFDLTQVATEWVAKIFNNRKSSGVLTESTEGQSITYKSEKASSEFMDRISSYRNIKV